MRFRKFQVLAVVSFWSLYLFGGNRHGPPGVRALSRRLSARLTAWQSFVITLLWLYVARNFGKLVGLECPEPLANLYTRAFFRATWITTALDAGFWTAMRIRRAWLRDAASVVFSLYYLFAAEQADEKVRKVRGTLTVEHLRVSWNKATASPYLARLGRLLRPQFTRYAPRPLRIARPRRSAYAEPVAAWLYFDGPPAALARQRRIVLDIPGGGFVAMDPRANDDKLLAWAGRTGVPVLSLDYRKAPEYPYPYALNECYDVYCALVASRGRCVGLSGEHAPTIVVTGDSAGGNLATGVVLMVLQNARGESRAWQREGSSGRPLPPPAGLILIYPALDMNINSWMSDEQMALLKDRRMRKTNRNVLRRKSEDYKNLTPDTPHPSDDEDDGGVATATATAPTNKTTATAAAAATTARNGNSSGQRRRAVTTGAPKPDSGSAGVQGQRHAHGRSGSVNSNGRSGNGSSNGSSSGNGGGGSIVEHTTTVAAGKPQPLRTRLAMSSMISYFNDRILTPEMMRAMVILYVGPHHRPDFATDYLLSPVLAPDRLLADFPPTYFQTGERDPLVDDTVIFAGRIRQAKYARWAERRAHGLLPPPPPPPPPAGYSGSSNGGHNGSNNGGSSIGSNGGGNGKDTFDEREHVQVALVPGISHGFLQFAGVFPDAWKCIFRCARWMNEIFAKAEAEATVANAGAGAGASVSAKEDAAAVVDDAGPMATAGGRQGLRSAPQHQHPQHPQQQQQQQQQQHTTSSLSSQDAQTPSAARKRHHRRVRTGGSSGEEDRPLEMMPITASRRNGAGVPAAPSPLLPLSSSASAPTPPPPSSSSSSSQPSQSQPPVVATRPPRSPSQQPSRPSRPVARASSPHPSSGRILPRQAAVAPLPAAAQTLSSPPVSILPPTLLSSVSPNRRPVAAATTAAPSAATTTTMKPKATKAPTAASASSHRHGQQEQRQHLNEGGMNGSVVNGAGGAGGGGDGGDEANQPSEDVDADDNDDGGGGGDEEEKGLPNGHANDNDAGDYFTARKLGRAGPGRAHPPLTPRRNLPYVSGTGNNVNGDNNRRNTKAADDEDGADEQRDDDNNDDDDEDDREVEDDDDGEGEEDVEDEEEDEDDDDDDERSRTRNASSVSLASEHDLMGRRMKGLASGLLGMTSLTMTMAGAANNPVPVNAAAANNNKNTENSADAVDVVDTATFSPVSLPPSPLATTATAAAAAL